MISLNDRQQGENTENRVQEIIAIITGDNIHALQDPDGPVPVSLKTRLKPFIESRLVLI